MTVLTETFDRPSGLVVMGRVIYALILRESRTRYGRNAFGFVWAFLTPARLGGALYDLPPLG